MLGNPLILVDPDGREPHGDTPGKTKWDPLKEERGGGGRITTNLSNTGRGINPGKANIDYSEVKLRLLDNRVKGLEFEKKVGMDVEKVKIKSMFDPNKERIPDKLTKTTIEEAKNVNYLSFTKQLQDYALFAQKNNLSFIIHTTAKTISKPILEQFSLGNLIIKPYVGF